MAARVHTTSAVVALGLAACATSLPDVSFRCESNDSCVEPFVCAEDRVCRLPSGVGAGDALPSLFSAGLKTLPVGGALLLEPRDGTPPYVFSLDSGSGTFNGATFTPDAPGVMQLRATDAEGRVARGRVYVFEQVLAVGGAYHFCVIVRDGRVKCWGFNNNGVLGLGDVDNRGDAPNEMGAELPFIDLGEGRRALSLAAGKYFNCALLDTLQVKCWGNNSMLGELGLGDAAYRGDAPGELGDALPTVSLGGALVLALSCGGHHTCVLLEDGAVKCWGSNEYGQLGLGDAVDRGALPRDMGGGLPAVTLGLSARVRQVSLGKYHSCVLDDDGAVKCWGFNSQGQLGIGATDMRGDAPGEMGEALPFADLWPTKRVRRLFAGGAMTCALAEDDELKCWGNNGGGQLGLERTDSLGDAPAELGAGLPVVQLGTGFVPIKVVPVGHLSNGRACALSKAGAVKCWGANGSGELGQGDAAPRGHAPGTMGDALPAVDLGAGAVAIDLIGAGHSNLGSSFCAKLTTERWKCWGNGSVGQLGRGNAVSVGLMPGDMGDALPLLPLE